MLLPNAPQKNLESVSNHVVDLLIKGQTVLVKADLSDLDNSVYGAVGNLVRYTRALECGLRHIVIVSNTQTAREDINLVEIKLS